MWHVQGYSGSHWTPPLGNYLLQIAPAAARAQANKQHSTNTPTLLAIFDGRGGAPVRYCANHPMEEVQGFG
jgi:hypothetical protein